MGYVYCLTNIANGMQYVGATTKTIEQRMRMHVHDSNKENWKNSRLYSAIHEYGFDLFRIEILEECSDDILYNREKYWIEALDTRNRGYNICAGGAGTPRYDHNHIAMLLRQNKSTREIKEMLGCCEDVVRITAQRHGIRIHQPDYCLVSRMHMKKVAVDQYDLSGNYLRSFDSYSDAAKWLNENGYCKESDRGGARTKISQVCSGERRTAYKFIWKYGDVHKISVTNS